MTFRGPTKTLCFIVYKLMLVCFIVYCIDNLVCMFLSVSTHFILYQLKDKM